MNQEHQKHLDDISLIRNMMERSSRFISLSGLSGIFAGIFALLGSFFGFWYTQEINTIGTTIFFHTISLGQEINLVIILTAALVFFFAISFGSYFTTKKAGKKNLPIWDLSTKRLVINLLLPLIPGGIFCLILLFTNHLEFVAGATLLFYGMALINAGHFTLHDIKYLGAIQMGLGIFAALFTQYSLYIWSLGFGLLHVVYGVLMYYKYER